MAVKDNQSQIPLSSDQINLLTTPRQNVTREAIDYTTLCDAVANKLRQEILSGAQKPGQKLNQTIIADRFGISRMPIRDAFRILEGEGLILLKPGKGAFVAKVDLAEFIQIYQVREVLESLAIRLSTPHLSDKQLAGMAKSVEIMEKVAKQGDLGRWVELDRSFHLAAYQNCQNPTLLRLIVSLSNASQYYRRIILSDPTRTEDTLKKHKELLDAFMARDSERAASLMTEHIRGTVRGILHDQSRIEKGVL